MTTLVLTCLVVGLACLNLALLRHLRLLRGLLGRASEAHGRASKQMDALQRKVTQLEADDREVDAWWGATPDSVRRQVVAKVSSEKIQSEIKNRGKIISHD